MRIFYSLMCLAQAYIQVFFNVTIYACVIDNFYVTKEETLSLKRQAVFVCTILNIYTLTSTKFVGLLIAKAH